MLTLNSNNKQKNKLVKRCKGFVLKIKSHVHLYRSFQVILL